MTRITPWVTGVQSEEISRLAARLVGLRVTSVEYLTTVMLHASEDSSDLHEVDQAVALELDNDTSLTVAWAMDGYMEGLAFISNSYPEEFHSDIVARFDVSKSHLWRAVISHRIVSVAVSAHIANESCPETIWSVRIDFDVDTSIVIALGDSGGGEPEYRPDGLVVIGDMAVARRYSTSSGDTALGQVVPSAQ